jgi:hypothetical protein
MLAAMQRQLSDPDIAGLRFEDRLAMLLQHELADRENACFNQRLRKYQPYPVSCNASHFLRANSIHDRYLQFECVLISSDLLRQQISVRDLIGIM